MIGLRVNNSCFAVVSVLWLYWVVWMLLKSGVLWVLCGFVLYFMMLVLIGLIERWVGGGFAYDSLFIIVWCLLVTVLISACLAGLVVCYWVVMIWLLLVRCFDVSG